MLRNARKFMRGFASVYAAHTRNPATSGSVTSEARLRDAAGSDSGKKYRLSGPGTPVGMRWNKTGNAGRGEACERQLCKCNRHKFDPETAK